MKTDQQTASTTRDALCGIKRVVPDFVVGEVETLDAVAECRCNLQRNEGTILQYVRQLQHNNTEKLDECSAQFLQMCSVSCRHQGGATIGGVLNY
jgi:hypothetical protein